MDTSSFQEKNHTLPLSGARVQEKNHTARWCMLLYKPRPLKMDESRLHTKVRRQKSINKYIF